MKNIYEWHFIKIQELLYDIIKLFEILKIVKQYCKIECSLVLHTGIFMNVKISIMNGRREKRRGVEKKYITQQKQQKNQSHEKC